MLEEFAKLGSAWMSLDASQGPRERDLQSALTAAMRLKVKELHADIHGSRAWLASTLCCDFFITGSSSSGAGVWITRLKPSP